MHSLQTYGQEEPVFNNNAYGISSIYHGGQLKMFTSHLLKTTTSDPPKYHMTQIKGWSITSDFDTFNKMQLGTTMVETGQRNNRMMQSRGPTNKQATLQLSLQT
jgi:hypothetical protein